MKIAFLMNHFDTTNIPKNPRHIGYYITKHLKRHGAEVEIIPPAVPKATEFYYKIKQAYYKYFLKKRHLRYSEIRLIQEEAKIRSEILKKSNADFTFSFGPIASAFLETDKKIAYWTDSTVAGLLGYHPDFLNLTKSTIKNTDYLERLCIARSSVVFLTSNWAKDIAIKAYSNITEDSSFNFFTKNNNQKISDKMVIAPFGANIDNDHSEEQIVNFIQRRLLSDEIKILFISYSWLVKGGDIAVEIVKRINEKGHRAKLIIIGCNPELPPELMKYVEIIGSIDKINNFEKMNSFLENSFFYLSPARAENFGHALVEANSFGVPSISTITGGVTDVIKNGINGQLFDLNASIDEFADYIINTFEDKEKYRQLCLSSFNEYKTRLNWNYGTKIVYDTLKNILESSLKS